jgi:hypothetical protein
MFTITKGPAEDMQVMIAFAIATVLVVFPCILAAAGLFGWLGQRRGSVDRAEQEGVIGAGNMAHLPAPSAGRAAAA